MNIAGKIPCLTIYPATSFVLADKGQISSSDLHLLSLNQKSFCNITSSINRLTCPPLINTGDVSDVLISHLRTPLPGSFFRRTDHQYPPLR